MKLIMRRDNEKEAVISAIISMEAGHFAEMHLAWY